MHKCHANSCQKQTPEKMFMCNTHWAMVPSVLQKAIWATYRSGQEKDKNPSEAYLKNAKEAIAAVHEKEYEKR
jgi:hypothetical protein